MNEAEHWAIWLSELRRWATTCLSRKAEWQVKVLGQHWVCPYCVKVLALSGPAETEFDQVIAHLVDGCKGFEEIGVPPTTPLETLEYKALAFFIKKRLTSHAAWQMRDAEGCWICPYCTHPSGIRIAGKLDKQTLAAIIDNVACCASYQERGGDNFYSVDEIRTETAKRSSLQQSIEELTSWMDD